MGTVTPLQADEADGWMSMERECCDPKGPIIEALRLLALLETGDTVADVRRLIAVPHHIEASLRAFIAAHPDERFPIASTLASRQDVPQASERFLSTALVDPRDSLYPTAVP